ncbi:hypothetical protein B7463_g7272, partial [Scytalidium lignicola]
MKGLTQCMASRIEKRPMLVELRSSTWFITLAVCMAIFTDMFLYAVIVPVFPFSLAERLHVPENDAQHWMSVLLSVYGAALLLGAPIFGFLADRLEYRRTPLLIGLVALGGSTLTICLARSLSVLIVGRVLQGFSASITWVVGLTLLADTAKKDSVAQSFGYVGAASSLGTVIAPVLGGIIYHNVGYYPVFAMCFALVAIDILLRLTIIEKKSAAKWLQLSHVNIPQWNAAEPAVVEILALQMLDDNTSHDITIADPIVSGSSPENNKKKKLPAILSLWKSPRMLAAFWGDFATATVMVAFDTTLALFVNRTFHWSSLQAGLTFLALLLPTFLGPVLGIAADKYGARWISVFGLIFMIPPLILLRLVNHESINQIVLLCALLLLTGLGAAMALTGLYAEYSKICDAIEAKHPGSLGNNGGYAQSYGISEIAWALAGLVGPLMAGRIYQTAGWGTLGWSLSLLCVVTVIPTLLFINR